MPLAALHRSMMAREEARLSQAALQGLVAGSGWRAIELAGDGRLAGISPAALRILRYFFGDFGAGSRVDPPARLASWLGRRSRNWGLDRLDPAARAPFVATRGGARLTAHFIADPLAPERGRLLLRRERAAPAPEELAPLPLTPRERQVLTLVAAGKTNREIGAVLDVSPRTAQKHLEHVFEKLGVETRTAAALRAQAAALAAAGAEADE